MNMKVKKHLRWYEIVGSIPVLIYVTFIGLPLVVLVVQVAGDKGFFLGLTGSVVTKALTLSLLTSVVAMLFVVFLGTPLAYTLARSRGKIATFVDGLVELPIVLPPVVAGLAMLIAFGRRGVIGGWLTDLGIVLPFTTIAVVMAQIFVAAPFYVRSARLGFTLVSREYEEMSYTLGRTPWQTFWRVTLPLSWPSLVSGLSLAWARALSEFGATIMFAGNLPGKTQTMPLAIMTELESDIDAALAMAVVLVAVSMVILATLLFLRNLEQRNVR